MERVAQFEPAGVTVVMPELAAALAPELAAMLAPTGAHPTVSIRIATTGDDAYVVPAESPRSASATYGLPSPTPAGRSPPVVA
ncbi:hypothetical protein [Micromonospora polyrhachis]|uniref:Uncharacterized protein n=1 Tax=Micromonospora polyrhachis TaxID=1282883 RepID=A0A7W7STG0_9ACTN|nr:hypothetical protein [Micromonospora polyrhachis]MBB4959430.1 hypothetical protein [Micromonospora polyrhachis]